MASTINVLTTGVGGIQQTGDTSGILQMQTNGTATLTIDTSGNVGIGTATPGTKLHVLGTSQSAIFSTTNATLQYTEYRYNTSTTNGYIGNGGILTGSGTATDFVVRSENALVFASGGATERMRIDPVGAIGIGPTANYGTSGQFLTSNGSGAAASWTTVSAGGMTLLGTVAATSGNSVSLGSLTLTSYKALFIASNNVSTNTTGVIYITSGNTQTGGGFYNGGSGASPGNAWIDLTAGTVSSSTSTGGVSAAQTNVTTSTTTIYFRAAGANTFTGGSYIIWGLK